MCCVRLRVRVERLTLFAEPSWSGLKYLAFAISRTSSCTQACTRCRTGTSIEWLLSKSICGCDAQPKRLDSTNLCIVICKDASLLLCMRLERESAHYWTSTAEAVATGCWYGAVAAVVFAAEARIASISLCCSCFACSVASKSTASAFNRCSLFCL